MTPVPPAHPGLALLRLLKWLGIALACLIVLAVAGVWALGRSIPSVLDSTLSSQGNSGLTCETNDTNLFAGRIDLGGLAVLNPPEFKEREFLRIRRLVVDVEPATFLADGRRVVEEVTLDIDRVTLVGKGGADLLGDNNATAIAKAFRDAAKASAPAEPAAAAKPGNDFIIRRLKIRVGGVTLLQEQGGRRQVLLSDNEGLAFEASDVTAQNIGDTVVAPLGGLALTRAAAANPESILDFGRRQLERNRK